MVVKSLARDLKAEDLSKIVLVSNPSISHNGLKIAFLASKLDPKGNNIKSNIWIYDREGIYPLTSGPRDYCPSWSYNDSLISYVTKKKKGFSLKVLKIGHEKYEIAFSRQPIESIKWSSDNKAIIYLSRSDDKEWKNYVDREALIIDTIPPYFNGEGFIFDRPRNIFMVSYPHGEVIQLTNNKYGINSFDISPNGEKVVYSAQQDELKPYLNEIRILNLRTNEDIGIIKDYMIEQVLWSPKEEKVAFLGNKLEKGFATHVKLYIANLKNGEVKQVWPGLNRNIENSINSDVRGPSCNATMAWGEDNRIYFLLSDQGHVHLYATNEKGNLKGILRPKNYVIDEFSISDSGQIIAYTKMSDREPKEIYYYDGFSDKKISEFNKGFIERYHLSNAKYYKTKSEDGSEIEYWVLLPEALKEGNPWILYIHGGPKTFYGYSFNFIFHYLSSRGFAVIYGNPHGSDSYTEEFADIRGKYGEIDYADLMSIVDDALKQIKQLDPEKGAVAGGSYGGFMTNWIVTKTNRFKVAVTERSCSNWLSFYGSSDIGWYFTQDQLKSRSPWLDIEKFKEKSPLFYADKVTTPLLIMHALEDYRCPYEQALQLFVALKNLNSEVRLALFPKENHDLTRSGRPKSRIKYMEILLDWLEKHLE